MTHKQIELPFPSRGDHGVGSCALKAGGAGGGDGNSRVTLKNFGKVNDNYYRGEQPTLEEFAQLKRFGVKTVIDLRKDSLRQAPEQARNSGLQYFNIPLLASRAATEEQTSHFLSLVNDPANWPVYVHCKGGRHRTGGMTAIYRITHDGWTADQAYQEMMKYDFNNAFRRAGAQKGTSMPSSPQERARQRQAVNNVSTVQLITARRPRAQEREHKVSSLLL